MSLKVIHATGMTVADVRKVTVARGFEVIFVDYLQNVDPGRGVRRDNRFGGVSPDLDGLAQLGFLFGGSWWWHCLS